MVVHWCLDTDWCIDPSKESPEFNHGLQKIQVKIHHVNQQMETINTTNDSILPSILFNCRASK